MTQRKQRVTVTIDPALIEAANRAVSAGLVDSLSAWVNQALTEQASRDGKLHALSEAVAGYETEFGEITAEEITVQRRTDRRQGKGTV